MLVKDRMTPNPIIITPDTPFSEAFRHIREKGIRHLPVLDHNQKLIGIVARADLLHASPSTEKTLSIFEVNYLLISSGSIFIVSRSQSTITGVPPALITALIVAQNVIVGTITSSPV